MPGAAGSNEQALRRAHRQVLMAGRHALVAGDDIERDAGRVRHGHRLERVVRLADRHGERFELVEAVLAPWAEHAQ